MLAYAGKGPLEMQLVDVNLLVHEMTQLLRVSLPKGVAFTFRLAEALPSVQGDPTQIRTTARQQADQAHRELCWSGESEVRADR